MMEKGKQHYIDAGQRAMKWHQEHRNKMKKKRFETIAVHGIYSLQEALDFNQGSLIEPIYLSTSQVYRDSDEMEAALSYQIPTWAYSRIANPSMYYLEGTLGLLEGYGTGLQTTCTATSSGMSAIRAVIDALLVPNQYDRKGPLNFVAPTQVYGGSYQQFEVRQHEEKGVEWRKVMNPGNLKEWESLIDKNTCFLFGELPSNPGLTFFDLAEVAKLAKANNIPLVIDSTISSPALLRPLEFGADIVVHSVTKTLAASGFGICGAVISKKNITSKSKNAQLKEDFAGYLKLLPNRDNGPNISPIAAYMALNDIRTIRSRMTRLSRHAQLVAEHLEGHKHIERVNYLGLKSNPLHEIASKYMWLVDAEHDMLYYKKQNRYGHLMSFNVKGDNQKTRKVFDNLELIWRGTDLGRIKSIACIPAISTHQQQGADARKMAAIPDNLIRLCIGGEHPEDIIADLDRALSVLDGKSFTITSPEFSSGGASSSRLGRFD